MDPSRISLRRFELSDADHFLKWASDDKVTRYLRWNTITSREEALSYLEKVAIPQPYRRSICLDDHSIGYVSIKPGSGDDKCRAHLGYAVSAEYWGQGIATAAVKMAVSDAFKVFPGLVRLEAFVEVENQGSQKLLEKVGFLKEGLLRKYGLCKDEHYLREKGIEMPLEGRYVDGPIDRSRPNVPCLVKYWLLAFEIVRGVPRDIYRD